MALVAEVKVNVSLCDAGNSARLGKYCNPHFSMVLADTLWERQRIGSHRRSRFGLRQPFFMAG
jgi:hypothetical protein